MPIKVSVIVPVYNPGSYIDECIASVLRQSLPATEYEAIFVDDGSTDGTGERLDALAAQHANISAIHIPNSGWPGRPRNVGMDAAKGKYVFFMDNDDWLGDEALERLYERAERNEADVVMGKVVGVGNAVSWDAFRRNVDDATLDASPILSPLTVHKLFRTSLLRAHGIRFPEGRRRLEDHLFVMPAFFAARRISILADYACYYWRRRDDGRNAAAIRASQADYYKSVRMVLDIIDRHTRLGRARDRLYAHWYRGKGLHRLRGRGWADGPSRHALQVYSEVRRLALERFGPAVTRELPMTLRVLSRAVTADRVDLVKALARVGLGIRAEIELHTVEWADSTLRISVGASFSYEDGTPITLVRSGDRLHWELPQPLANERAILADDLDVSSEFPGSQMDILIRHRTRGLVFLVPMTVEPAEPDGSDRISVSFTAAGELDPALAGAGTAIGDGIWDISIRVASCGWESLRRLRCSRRQLGRVKPAIVRGTASRAVPYVTLAGSLSLKISSPGMSAGADIIRRLRARLSHSR